MKKWILASMTLLSALLAAGAAADRDATLDNNTLAAKNQCRVLRDYGNSQFYQGDEIVCGVFSQGQRYMVVGTSGRVREKRTTVWDLNGKMLANLDVQSIGLRISDDGTVLYALASDGILHAIETATWVFKWHLEVPSGTEATMTMLDNGMLCVLDPSHGVVVIDVTRRVVDKTRQTGKFLKGTLSPDGSLIALYGGDAGKRHLSVQDALSGRTIRCLDHNPPEGNVAFAFSKDNKSLALSGDDGISLVDLASGISRELKKPSRPQPLHTPGGNGGPLMSIINMSFTSLSFSNHGDMLMGVTNISGLYAFRLKDKVEITNHYFRDVNGIVFAPDDSKALLLGRDMSDQARLCEMPSAKPLFTVHGTCGSGEIFFSPDRSYFVMLCENYQLRVYETSTGKTIASLQHNYPVNQIIFTPDGKRMVAGDNRNKIVVWRTDTWETEQVISDHDDCVTALALSSDKKTLYSGDRKGVIIMRDLATLKKQASFKISSKKNPEVWVIAASPDHILAGTNEATVEVFDRKTNKLLKILTVKSHPTDGGGYYISAVAYSPKAKTYCALSHDGILYSWDSQTLELLKTIDCGGKVGTHRVAYAPGGRYIMVTCRGKGMRIYDAKTGVEVFGYTSIDVGNVDDMYWENGELIVTIATEGYVAQRIAIHPDLSVER